MHDCVDKTLFYFWYDKTVDLKRQYCMEWNISDFSMVVMAD